MPNPQAQQFKEIPPPIPTLLPTHLPDYRSLVLGKRVTRQRLQAMLDKIDPGLLSIDETNLLAFVVRARENAFAFEYAEKGNFSRDYYPDYEIPTIEHTPWQRRPIPIPLALLDKVRNTIIEQEKAGRFEPTTSSVTDIMYRSHSLHVLRSGDRNYYLPILTCHCTLFHPTELVK